MNKQIQKAMEVLKSEGIIIFPTDTVMGIGCRIDSKDSLSRLFEIKKRDSSQAVPVLVSSIEMAEEYISFLPKDVKELMQKYWPGGLTIVLPCKKEKVLPLVRGDGDNVGFRIPDMPSVHEIIEKVGVPIVGTSANFHGNPSVTKYKDLDPELVALVDFVLEEDSLGGVASTVLDCSTTPWKVLRKGAVVIPDLIENQEKKLKNWILNQVQDDIFNMITLFLDTTSNKEIIVRLTIDDKIFEEKKEITPRETQLVLPLIVEILEKHNLKLSDLNAIDANPGPGSFTGVRVGAAVANSLIFALGLKQKLIEPSYS